jgi:general secretion pathway protein K
VKRIKRQLRVTQRGIALLAVISAITITGVVAVEFKINSQFDAFGSYNVRDQMVAENLARSSMNLSELVLRLQQVLDNPDIQQQIGKVQLTDYASMLMAAFGGTAEEVASTTGLSGEDAAGFGTDGLGYFDVRITSEDGKINLNCANGKPAYAKLTYTLLEGMMYFPVYDPIFEDPDADGWRRDRRQQVEALVDYVDEDRNKVPHPSETGPSGVSEDYGYENLPDKYKAKNNYLDTIDEIKLIRGVDDRFWAVFGDELTVYGGCKIAIAALESPKLIATILYLTAKDPEDPILRQGDMLWYHALAVAWARQNGLPFDTVDEFVKFVKDPEGELTGLLGGLLPGGGDAAPTPAAPIQIPGIPPGVDLGLTLDTQKANQVLRPGGQRTYRVVASGTVHRGDQFPPITREITAIWDMGNVNINQRSQDSKARNGSWVYLKIE